MWVWMLEGDTSRMAPAAVALLQRAAADARLFVCDISYWEVGVKAAKEKLVLSMDAPFWLRRAERAPGITGIPLDREILTLSTRLPGNMHADPADRILIAAAQLWSAALVTVDAAIIQYASRQRGVPVCDARP
jgi:PIN domain nuclease of toxin-antitoxin system